MTPSSSNTASSKDTQFGWPPYARAASILVSLIAGVYILYTLRDLLIPLCFAAIFAILLYPLCAKLEHWRLPRVLAVVISILVFIVVVGLLLYLVSAQIASFADEIPRLTTKVEQLLEELLSLGERHFNLSRTEQIGQSKRYLLNALGESRKVLMDTVMATTSTLTTTTLVPLYVFFFLLYRDFFRQFIHKVFRSVSRPRLNTLLSRMYEVIQNYLVGLVLVILIVGILNTIGLWALGIEYAVFFGFFAAFLILIPYIGILIGSLLPAFMSLVTKDSAWYSLGVIGMMGLVQFLEGNFITPKVVGSKVSINPFAAILLLLLGGRLWGVSGLILALPFTAILKVLLDASPSLSAFGYLLGEPEEESGPVASPNPPAERLPSQVRHQQEQQGRRKARPAGNSTPPSIGGRPVKAATPAKEPEATGGRPIQVAALAKEPEATAPEPTAAATEPSTNRRRRPSRRRKKPTDDTKTSTGQDS